MIEQKKNKGLLFVVSGPSGSGKGTIMSEFLTGRDDVFLSISATTRQKRNGEIDNVNYHFLSKEQFKENIEQDNLLEWAVYCDNYYGTLKQPVLDHLENGQDVILEIEVVGAMNVKKHMPEAVFVFILPPSMEVLEQRLSNRRTESRDAIKKRLTTAQKEFAYIREYNYIIINEEVLCAKQDFESIVRAEKLRIERVYKNIEGRFLK